ncbi:hypothetical protein CEXT_679801 [Caerostris extrusa]|uniref:Uncharacterized protein n=1 Tax=Caerostris extrusa TaxID=172846 RepID=A0AAV4VWV2_CAEEX|nr:hypothetical protein CEXT_679801 [Caerostris extrusa]
MIEAPEPKLLPIMVRYTDNLKDQIAEISNQFEDDVRIKLAGEQLKIFPANSDIHRAITKYLTDGKIEFYVITPKNQRPLKAVLKGLPVSYSADEIATGLAVLGLKIDQVRQLTNLKTKAPIPVWQIEKPLKTTRSSSMRRSTMFLPVYLTIILVYNDEESDIALFRSGLDMGSSILTMALFFFLMQKTWDFCRRNTPVEDINFEKNVLLQCFSGTP